MYENDNNSDMVSQSLLTQSEIINGTTFNTVINTQYYILIIDFPQYGGGTTHFINTIIGKYKNVQTFLVARNFNGNVQLTINNTNLNCNFENNDAISFLDSNKDRIIKIFINHTIGHQNDFLESLFNLNKEITYISHDFYSISHNPQPLYCDILSKTNIKDKIYLNRYNNIITQNICNLSILSEYLDKNQNIIITELPDFIKSDKIVNTNNTKLIIGLIGLISDIKGKKIISLLNNYIQSNNLNIEFIVFGKIHLPIKQYKYNSINEFNELLIQHKPNVLLECSIWHETYSYTLTLSMITQLPIITLEKHFDSVIHNRLLKYEKTYYFDKINDFFDLVFKVKQNYFYTVEPTIYFNSFWDNYFINTNEKQNIVLITSKIIVSSNNFTYSSIRSSYTAEERFIQTIETIESIRKYIPNSYIVLVDNSKLNQNMKDCLFRLVNNFINETNDANLNYYTDVCEYKAFADISQQIKFYDVFLKNFNMENFQNFFKISGRYLLNNNFNYYKFNNNKNIMKKNHKVTDREYYYTCFFKLYTKNLHDYFNSLKYVINNEELYKNKDCEVIIPETLHNNFEKFECLGITQRLAIQSKGLLSYTDIYI